MWPFKKKPETNIQDLLDQKQEYLLKQMEIKHQLNLIDETIAYYQSQNNNKNENNNNNTITSYTTDGLETAR